MGQNWCNRCSRYHNTPVGRNCSRKLPKVLPEKLTTPVHIPAALPVPGAMAAENVSGGTDSLLDNRDDEVIIDTPAGETETTTTSVENRLGSLEILMNKLSEKILSPSATSRHRRHRSPSWSSSEDEATHRSRHRRRSPSKSGSIFSYETLFNDEDIPVKNFEGVIYALFRTIECFVDEGKDISGLVSHGRFLAEKAIADSYTSDTFVLFDRFVRAKAGKKGYEAFNSISEQEKSRFFNLENHKEVRALKAKVSKQGNRKSGKTCRRYNGDLGCFAHTCNYVHRCANCEEVGHPVKDCKSTKMDKPKK